MAFGNDDETMTMSSASEESGRIGPRPNFLHQHGWLIVVCGLFLLSAWAYGLVIPPFENLDEIEHFSAIRYVAETGGLPVHDPVLQERYYYRQEASQPPLYYLLMGGLVRLLHLPTADTNSYFVANPFVACGPSDQPYNRHTLYHNPVREGFSLDRLGARPWPGALLTLHLLRVLASVLQLVTVVGVYAIARLVFSGPDGNPGRTGAVVAPLAAAITAFNPQFLSVASGVNNDNLVVPLATLGLYLVLVTYRRGPSFSRSLGMGLLAGLAGLSKLSGLLLLAPVGLVLLVSIWRSRRPSGRIRSTLASIAVHGLLAGAAALLVCGWWFWRNWQLYRDPTALEPMLKLVGRREAFVFPLDQSGLLFRSFWGQMACTFFSDPFYAFFSLLTIAGALGLFVAGLRGRRGGGGERGHWSGLFWLALWFGIVLAGWVRWDLLTPAPGGRLLFPAIGPVAILLAYGLLSLWPSNWRRWVVRTGIILLAAAALAALRWEVYPLFSSPPTFDAEEVPPIASPLQATFAPADSVDAPQLGLLGYEAAVGGEGSWLDLTLYWQALAPIAQDYALAIQLASPVPGDETLRFNYNTWPGRGNLPTTAWTAGRVIADHYRFNLPESEAQLQAWQLLVAFYETESGERLRVRMDGQDIGGALALTTLRVPGRAYACPAGAAQAEPVLFAPPSAEGEAVIRLAGATVAPATDAGPSALQVTLCWESLAPAALDYTVFVHLYDQQGELVATGDGPPLNGAYPTHLWQPGDRVVDGHLLAAPSGDPGLDDGYQVGVGLYDLGSGLRLRALQAGQPVANDAVLLRP